MGKGQIKSGGEDGLYTIDLIYPTTSFDLEISALNAKIADLTSKYNAFPVDLTPSQEQDKKVILLTKTAMEKRKQSLEADFEETKTVSAWCADLSEELTGDVGTIEVPGESENINIRPGYTDSASYDAGRDGQLQQLVTMDYAGVFYNLAMLPGWQKWKPTYRYGTITNLSGDTVDVSLEGATSTQQGLNVNQEETLTGVPIEYMDCDGKAFEDGDEVLVQFVGQDFTNPKVIGFKQEPKECPSKYIVITHGGYVTIFSYWVDDQEITVSKLKYPDTSDNVIFPVLASEISFFYDDLVEIGEEEMFFKTYQSAKDTNSFGPISGLLACPLYSWLLSSHGGVPIGGCDNLGWPCRYGHCHDGPYSTPRAFNVSGWVDKDGNAIPEATQTSEVDSQAWLQEMSSWERNDLAQKWYIEHSEKLDYYSCEKWRSNMSVGELQVGLITSKDLFSVRDYERTNSEIYIPNWLEYEHTVTPPYNSTIDNSFIYTKYVKKFPMGIPDLEYAKADCYVANTYQDPRFTETEPVEYFGFKGVYSKDIAVAVLAYRVENKRHLETEPVTIIEQDIIPKTLASVNIHWQETEWSNAFDPWNMTETNTLIKSKVQEMFDIVGGYNLETTIEFWELSEEEE